MANQREKTQRLWFSKVPKWGWSTSPQAAPKKHGKPTWQHIHTQTIIPTWGPDLCKMELYIWWAYSRATFEACIGLNRVLLCIKPKHSVLFSYYVIVLLSKEIIIDWEWEDLGGIMGLLA